MPILNVMSVFSQMAPEMSACCATFLWHEFYLLTSQGCNNRRTGKKVTNVWYHSRFPRMPAGDRAEQIDRTVL